MGSQAVAANAPDGEGTPAHREHPVGLREKAQRQLLTSPKFKFQRWGERQAVATEVWAFLESLGAREAGGGAWRPQSKGPVDLMRTGKYPKNGLEFRCQRHRREPPKVGVEVFWRASRPATSVQGQTGGRNVSGRFRST